MKRSKRICLLSITALFLSACGKVKEPHGIYVQDRSDSLIARTDSFDFQDDGTGFVRYVAKAINPTAENGSFQNLRLDFKWSFDRSNSEVIVRFADKPATPWVFRFYDNTLVGREPEGSVRGMRLVHKEQ
jgi:hypothetical protein